MGYQYIMHKIERKEMTYFCIKKNICFFLVKRSIFRVVCRTLNCAAFVKEI